MLSVEEIYEECQSIFINTYPEADDNGRKAYELFKCWLKFDEVIVHNDLPRSEIIDILEEIDCKASGFEKGEEYLSDYSLIADTPWKEFKSKAMQDNYQ